MTTAELLNRARAILTPFGEEAATSDPDRTDFVVGKDQLEGAARALKHNHWGNLSAITGLDHGPGPGGTLEVLYTFCDRAAAVTLRVALPREDAEVRTLRDVVPLAVLFERELSEMFGIAIEGETDNSHEFLSDDWPAGSYPLRKDWKAEIGLPGRAKQMTAPGADDGHQAGA